MRSPPDDSIPCLRGDELPVRRLPHAEQTAPRSTSVKAKFSSGQVKLYVPYLCFQEARNLIAKSLPSNRCSDLLEFHRFAADSAQPPGISTRYENCLMPRWER